MARRLIETTKRRPADKTASLVTSKGVGYVSPKIVLSDESEVPYQLKRVPLNTIDLTGVRCGRLVVCGIASGFKGRWSCRCDCGVYVLRSARACTNQANADRCEQCRHVAYLRRKEEWMRLGYNTEATDGR